MKDLNYDGARVGADRLFRGYQGALHRVLEALGEEQADPAFFAVFEALSWAVALDEQIGELWRPAGKREGFDWRGRVAGGERMDGVRYARNRVHHQWADALRLDVDCDGVLLRGHSWEWRDIDELPEPSPGRDRGKDAYREMVAREPRVAFVLKDLEDVFAWVLRLLEPEYPASRPH